MRAYDSLLGHARELAETAARLGGAAGEVLLEECAAKARLLPAAPWSHSRPQRSASHLPTQRPPRSAHPLFFSIVHTLGLEA